MLQTRIFFGAVIGILLPSSVLANFSLTPYIGDFNRARAGGAAAAEDATTTFTNPAGLVRLAKQQWVVTGHYYLPSAEFRDTGTIDGIGNAISGGDGGDGGVEAAVPNAFYARPLSSDWTMGVALAAPFGLGTKYESNWVGRYHSIEAGIETMAINPGVGFNMGDGWSVGAGVTLQYAKATMSSALDFGAICLNALDPATCAGLGMPAPQSADGMVVMEGDDWGHGINVGLLWSGENTRFGLSYRSKVEHTLDGDATFTTPAGAAAFQPMFVDTGMQLAMTLPEILSVSVYHQWSSRLAVMADITGTRWSRIERFEFQYDNPAQPTQTVDKDWEDTWRLAVGADYQWRARWKLQGGVAFEQSALPDRTFDPSIPVADAIWLVAGAEYSPSDKMSLGFGWTHIVFEDRTVNHVGAMGDTLRGDLEPSLDVIDLRVKWLF